MKSSKKRGFRGCRRDKHPSAVCLRNEWRRTTERETAVVIYKNGKKKKYLFHDGLVSVMWKLTNCRQPWPVRLQWTRPKEKKMSSSKTVQMSISVVRENRKGKRWIKYVPSFKWLGKFGREHRLYSWLTLSSDWKKRCQMRHAAYERCVWGGNKWTFRITSSLYLLIVCESTWFLVWEYGTVFAKHPPCIATRVWFLRHSLFVICEFIRNKMRPKSVRKCVSHYVNGKCFG